MGCSDGGFAKGGYGTQTQAAALWPLVLVMWKKILSRAVADLPPQKEVNKIEPVFRVGSFLASSERGSLHLRADRAVIRSGSASHSESSVN
ncbi:hypothetical protein QBC45DRAFT_419524 [Copromyces sp. CBS 386.78]|nr:hypothetical protein QBC45DRAFT_419524 [Copromyces sp. CBS 386.78]